MSEYQQALANGEITKERDPSVQQMADGAKQIFSGAKNLYDAKVAPGAKEFFSEKVAPAAKNAATSARRMSGESSNARTGTLHVWTRRAPIILPAAAFLGIIALFLPIGSAFGMSINFFSNEVGGEGVLLLILMLLVIAGALAAIVTRTKWAKITAGVLGLIGGLFGIFDGFGNMINLSGERGISIGFGLVLLAIVGVVLLIASGLVLLGLRRQTSPSTEEAA